MARPVPGPRNAVALDEDRAFEALFAPVGLFGFGKNNFRLYVLASFFDRIGQHVHVLVRPFDAVKWSF